MNIYKLLRKIILGFFLMLNLMAFININANVIKLLDFETSGGYNITNGSFDINGYLPYQGNFSIKSTNPSSNQTEESSLSCFEFTLNILADSKISFYKKVSSEVDCDYLQFYIDGNLKGNWSGEIGWAENIYDIGVGNHRFTWCYKKDDSVDTGYDAMWIDYIRVIENNNILYDFENPLVYPILSGSFIRTTNTAYQSNYSMSSNNHAEDSRSCFDINRNILADSKISFYKKVSSEEDYDYLQFYIDGNLKGNWSGEIGWSENTYDIGVGYHRFTWCYKKDGSDNLHNDNTQVDYIRVIENNNILYDFENPLVYPILSGSFIRTTNTAYQGNYSMSSNNHAEDSKSCFDINRNVLFDSKISFYKKVSSEVDYDYLKFYIDGNLKGNWSGEIGWSENTYDIGVGYHRFTWCYEKDGSDNLHNDNTQVDYIRILDATNPNLSINFPSFGSLLANSDTNLNISYSDIETGINTSNNTIRLYKWNGTSYGTDISSSYINFPSSSINYNGAIYPISKLGFGKYKIDFSVYNGHGLSTTKTNNFYVDEPELILGTGSINIGKLKGGIQNFGNEDIQITVKTVGAPFKIILNKESNLLNGQNLEIINWNGTNGFGYDISPYTESINIINGDQIIKTQPGNINLNGNKNTFVYLLRFGAKIGLEQAAGIYNSLVKIGIKMDY